MTKTQLIKRVKSFLWRAGLYTGLALATYLANIADIREVDTNKLLTIFVVTLAVYVLNEGTKVLNK